METQKPPSVFFNNLPEEKSEQLQISQRRKTVPVAFFGLFIALLVYKLLCNLCLNLLQLGEVFLKHFSE